MAGYFSVGTFREIGTAGTPQNLFSIENIDGSLLVKIRRLIVQCDMTVALATVTPVYRISRATGVPTGGTTLNKVQFDTANSSSANVICRGSTASDGGANSGPTATAGDALWEQYVMRVQTAVGQILMPDSEMVPYIVDTQDLVLRQNQALLVQVVAPAGGSNPATNHYIVACCWQEV